MKSKRAETGQQPWIDDKVKMEYHSTEKFMILNKKLVSELKDFAASHDDVRCIYFNENEDEFTIIVDDATSPNIIKYYNYCFALKQRFKEIKEFYIFDKEECENI